MMSGLVGDKGSELAAVELYDWNMPSCMRCRIDLEGVVVDEVLESTSSSMSTIRGELR